MSPQGNGGSVAVLLRLAEALEERPEGAPTTVKLVFFAAEEERARDVLAELDDLAAIPVAPETYRGADALEEALRQKVSLRYWEVPLDRVATTR